MPTIEVESIVPGAILAAGPLSHFLRKIKSILAPILKEETTHGILVFRLAGKRQNIDNSGVGKLGIRGITMM